MKFNIKETEDFFSSHPELERWIENFAKLQKQMRETTKKKNCTRIMMFLFLLLLLPFSDSFACVYNQNRMKCMHRTEFLFNLWNVSRQSQGRNRKVNGVNENSTKWTDEHENASNSENNIEKCVRTLRMNETILYRRIFFALNFLGKIWVCENSK